MSYEIYYSSGPFCKECGQKCEDHWLGIFNTKDGSKEMRPACFNLECWEGRRNACVRSGGHYYVLFSRKCKCGYSWICDML